MNAININIPWAHPIADWQKVAQVTVEPKVLRDGWLIYLRHQDHGVIHADNGKEAIYEFEQRWQAIERAEWLAAKYGAPLYIRTDPVAAVMNIARECGGEINATGGATFSAEAWNRFCTQLSRGR